MADAANNTAEAQLERILYVLAAAKGDEGLALDELATRLGVKPAKVYAEMVQVRDREDYYPAGSALGMLILLERDRVSVPLPGAFRRPTRLTTREAGALGLALRARAAEAPAERRQELLELAQALEKALTPPRRAPRPPARRRRAPVPEPAPETVPPRLAWAVALDPGEGALAGVRVLVERASASRTPVRIRYVKPGAAGPADRLIHPYALVSAEGTWYVIAHSPESKGMRLFRLDRVVEASLVSGAFEVPADFDPAEYVQGARPYFAEHDVAAVVRYSARVAPWVLERGEAEVQEDGSVVVRPRVADPRWLVRHVLGFAGEAEVLEPEELRDAVTRAAEAVAAASAGSEMEGGIVSALIRA